VSFDAISYFVETHPDSVVATAKTKKKARGHFTFGNSRFYIFLQIYPDTINLEIPEFGLWFCKYARRRGFFYPMQGGGSGPCQPRNWRPIAGV